MWSEDDGPSRASTSGWPRPSTRPSRCGRPPILVGGGGEKKTLRLVAKYADRCNLFASPDPAGPAAVAGKLDVLRGHCRREGTDYDRIRKTVLYTAPLSPGAAAAAQFTEVMSAYAALGVTEVHVMPMDGDPVGFVRNLGEHVIPRVADL